jgi:hypothetical protein
MPISIPKKPRDEFQGVNDTAVSFGEPSIKRGAIQADALDATGELPNGGQPPAEEVNSAGRTAAEEKAFVQNLKEQDRPVQEDPYGQALLEMGAGSLKSVAKDLMFGGAKTAAKYVVGMARPTAEELARAAGHSFVESAPVTARAGAEGVTGLRSLQKAVQAGEAPPEGLAEYARKLMGGHEVKPSWIKSTPEGRQYAERALSVGKEQTTKIARYAAQEAEAKKAEALIQSGALDNGFGSYAGKAPSDPFHGATNAGKFMAARAKAPVESPVVKQFSDTASQWLNDFAASLTTPPKGIK